MYDGYCIPVDCIIYSMYMRILDLCCQAASPRKKLNSAEGLITKINQLEVRLAIAEGD